MSIDVSGRGGNANQRAAEERFDEYLRWSGTAGNHSRGDDARGDETSDCSGDDSSRDALAHGFGF